MGIVTFIFFFAPLTCTRYILSSNSSSKSNLSPSTSPFPPKMNVAEPELDIKEEYKLWRKNCKYMYEYVSETALTWPSLTIQWLPEHKIDDVIHAKLLLGTHTAGVDPEYLKLVSTKLPKLDVELTLEHTQQNDPTQKPKVSSIIKISKKFEVGSEINRARYMPQDSNVVAALLNSGQVDIFALNQEASTASFDTSMESSYCLSWNSFKKGHLLTGLENNCIALRNVASPDTVIASTGPHNEFVNDVSWNPLDVNMFATVLEDDYMMLYDARSPECAVSSFHSVGSQGLNTLAFSPFSGNLVALGGSNPNINLIDLRMLSKKGNSGLLHTMMGHGGGISCLEFSPHLDGILASGSQDRRVIIWDLTKIGEEQVQEDAEDGSPEIFMMHAGHTGAISDLNWCPFAKWTLATLADDNIVHIWEVNKAIINAEKDLSKVVLE